MMRRLLIVWLASNLFGALALAGSADRAFDEAEAHLDGGDVARAGAVLREALLEHPDHAGLHYLMGCVFRTPSPVLPNEALEEFRITLRLDPNYPEAHASLAGMLVLSGRVEEAERVLREWVAANPDHPRALGQLGAFLQSNGRLEEGVALLEQAVVLGPTDATVWLALGRGRMRAGDLPGAVEALERARALDPGSAPIRYNLAQAYLGTDREADADVELAAYEELQRLREQRRTEDKRRGKLFEAIALQEAALRNDPDQPVMTYAELVSRYLQSHTRDDGRRFLIALADEHTGLAAPLVALALLERRDAPEQAWEWLRRARERNRYSLGALRVQLSLATTTERREELRGILVGLEGDPGAPRQLPALRSRLATLEGNLEEAEAILLEAQEERPLDPDLIRALAEVHIAAGQRVKALAVLQRLTAAEPQDGEAWFTLAMIEADLGLREPAAVHIERAVERGYETSRALTALANVLARRGEVERAVSLLERSLAMDPDQPESRRLLESLQSGHEGH